MQWQLYLIFRGYDAPNSAEYNGSFDHFGHITDIKSRLRLFVCSHHFPFPTNANSLQSVQLFDSWFFTGQRQTVRRSATLSGFVLLESDSESEESLAQFPLLPGKFRKRGRRC
jgi:hypothetical protein